MEKKYRYLEPTVLHTVLDLGGEVLIELELPRSGLKGQGFVVRMVPDNARILARELLQAADRADGQKTYLPN